MTSIYIGCMLIGNRFRQKYYNKETEDWKGSEECATVARLTYELMDAINMSMEHALDLVMETVLVNGFRQVEDHMWDDYCKGFLAGEIIGMPTKSNLELAELAEKKWDDDDGETYGYYQEVLVEVKNENL